MLKKLIVSLILISFFLTSIGPLPDVSAQSLIGLPAPGVMVNRSSAFEPLQLKGILVSIKNPLRFDFLVDKGNSNLYGQPLKDNITRLAKYFLTCLTVPEDDLWVNLSPYEKNRIVPGNFGVTLMGKDLLEQDYLLKQIMASLSYPENDLGKRFWQRVYRKSYELYGTTNIPINTFNKVWIIPKNAQVYVQGNAAFVVNSQLDVMLEADYKSYVRHIGGKKLATNSEGLSQNSGAYSQVFRDVILPELRQEVNEGKNFAVVRQVYNAMILATWYKRHLKDSLLGKMYVGQNKVKGVDIADKNAKEEIFQQYLQAYKKCVYNYIKEDYDPATKQTVARKYASGGMYFVDFAQTAYSENGNPRGGGWIGTDLALATVNVSPENNDGAMVSFPPWNAKITMTHPFHQAEEVAQESQMATPSEQIQNTIFNTPATFVPKFLQPLILALTLAVGGLVMTPSITSAASPLPSNVRIAANMNTQDAIYSFDKQIVSYKNKVRRQESLLNIFGILGKSEKSNLFLSGLYKEEVSARAMLADGKTVLDQPAVVLLEESNLAGQIEVLDEQIKQEEIKVNSQEQEFAKKNRYSQMHAGEIGMWQSNINYHKGVLGKLKAKRDQLDKEKKSYEDIQQTNQAVSNAVASGVLNSTNQVVMGFADVIGHSINNTETTVKLDTNLQAAQQKVSDAPERGTIRFYIEGGNEANPLLRYIGFGLEWRTPTLIHPTKAHDARQGAMDDELAKAAQNIKIRGNVFDMVAAVEKYASINAHLERLESTALPGLADEISQAKEAKRHQLVVITSSLIIPLKDLPAGSNVVITNAWMNMQHVEALLKAQGVEDQQQATQAGLTFEESMESVRGNLDVRERSRLKKITPSHVTVHVNPTTGTIGAGMVGWLIGFVTPEWKVYSHFDPQVQANVIKQATAVWQDARLNIYRQLKQTLLDLHKNQIEKITAEEAWKNRGNETDPEKLAEMSANIRELEEKVTAGQLAAMNMGVGAGLVENAGTLTEENLIKEAQTFVQGAFSQGVTDMRTQAQVWQDQLKANHKDRKNVPAILEAVNSITASMEAPLQDQDTEGMADTDATGGATVTARSFTIGLPSPIVSYTSGQSSDSPDAPTFITGLNWGSTLSPVFQTGGSKESRNLERQMNFAQEQFAMAQHGKGEGPKGFRQAIYAYLTASVAQEVVSSGQGFNFTQMLAYYRSTTPHDSYTVFSPQTIDPLHLIMKGINKLRHHAPEEASVITAKALIEELKLQAKEDMFEARADTTKGEHWQAWNMFLNGQSPFIVMTDDKGNACKEFNGFLEALRQEFKPLWEKGPAPVIEPLEIRLMRLHLETAKKLRSYGPDKVTYWTAPVLVRVGSSTAAAYWEGLRSGLTVDLADHKRAQIDSDMQIAQLEQEINRVESAWKLNQAGVEAKSAANKAMEEILLYQTEERPLIVEAPQERWPDIANAVGMAQPIYQELTRINKQGTEPRTVALNILASMELHPSIAEQMLGGISKDLIDWVRRARIEEVNAWIKKLQHQAEVDNITAARQVADLFAQQQFALAEFEKTDTRMKGTFAEWYAINQGYTQGLYSQAQLDQATNKLEHVKEGYLSARSQLEVSSHGLILACSVLGDEEQRTLGIDHVRLATAPVPQISTVTSTNVPSASPKITVQVPLGISVTPMPTSSSGSNAPAGGPPPPPKDTHAAVSAPPVLTVPPVVLLPVTTPAVTNVTPIVSSPVSIPTNTSPIILLSTPQSASTNSSSVSPQIAIPMDSMSASAINALPAQVGLSPTIASSATGGTGIAPLVSWGSAGFAILGLTLALGGISILKINKLKKLKKQSSIDSGKPSKNPGNNGKPEKWGFNVVTNDGPSIPDDSELAWQQQQQIMQPPVPDEQPITPTVDSQPINSGLRVMDVLGLILSTGLAGIFSGGDLKSMLTACLSSFFATRLIYAVYTFFHENGHNATALAQSPKNYKKILTWSNFFAEYSLPNWLRLILPLGKPTQLPGVDLPLYGKPRRINQVAGFIITSAVCGAAFWTAALTGLWLPLFGSLSAASLFAILNSWETDIRNPPAEGKILCGDSGFILLPKKLRSMNKNLNRNLTVEDFFPHFAQHGLANMRQISGLRGDQGGGYVTYVITRDGDVVLVSFKALKRRRGKPVVEDIQAGLKNSLEEAIKNGMRPSSNFIVIMTHDRFLTQGIPSLKGLHPHLGVMEVRQLCYFENGVYQKRERTVVSTVIENGDNNYHKKHGRKMPTREIRLFYPIKFHMEKSVFIEPNAKYPEGYYDYLPSGDAPALALQEQWYDNQGDLWASSRFAADEIFYKNDKEAMEYNMSRDEVDAMGDFYMHVYENGHEQILIRPELKKKNKTLADSWATQEMARKDPKFLFQYNALKNFRTDLKRRLLIEAEKARNDPGASVVGSTLNRLQQLHPEDDFENKVERFVNMTVERFFTADILQAAREIDQLEEEGAYGVGILSTKYPEKIVFWTKGQSVALGVNQEAGYIAFNSEHTALKSDFGDVPPVNEILFLNSEGQGQLTQINYDEDAQDINIRAWSPEKGRFLSEDELKEFRMQKEGNQYWTPLLNRNPVTVTDEDIDDITKVTRDVKARWQDPNSFVRQSAAYLTDKLESRFVEYYIKTNSRFYKVMQGNLLYEVEQQAQQCRGEQCNSEEYQGRVASLLREIQNDPRVLTYLKSRLDQLVAYQADILSQQIIRGRKTEDDLFPQLKIIDQRLSELMSSEIQLLTQNLMSNNVQFLRDFQVEQGRLALSQDQIEDLWDADQEDNAGKLKPKAEGQGLPQKESVGSGEADYFIGGFEDSLWLGSENLKAMMHVFFPQMIIETDSTNKALDLKPGDRHKVGRRTPCLIVSKSGATSPSKNLVNVLKLITGLDNIFGETGTPDTLLGLALGQRYFKDAPFCKRIFPTGNIYPTEVNSISEIELLVNQIEMVLYIVKRMKKTFPNQRPWGMNVSEENIKKIEEWRDNLVNKARHLTGIDEDGNPGTYPEHEKIIHDARIFGKMLTETPLSNFLNRAYVYSIIYLGTPIGLAAAYIENKTGLSVHSSGMGHLVWALLDGTLACTMPWWITTGFYRLFSGRIQRKARLGPPKVFIGDITVLHQVIENSASKRGSNAIGTMDADFHGGNPQDHFGARFGHRTGGRPGKLLIFGLPEDPHAFSDVTLTLSQSNVKTDMSVGWKIWDNFWGKRNYGSPETFTIGPENDIDPNLSGHHMSTGPFQTVFINNNGEREMKPGVTETLAQFHAVSFEVFDRLVAYNVFFNEGYRYATNWGPWQIWRQGETYSKTGVFSTPSPRGGPKKALPFYHDAGQPYSAADVRKNSDDGSSGNPVDGSKGDAALISERKPQTTAFRRKGGIDMNSRLMKLEITGETQNRIVGEDNAMSTALIKGVVPRVSQIVTVTPDMLRAMLGEAYLN